MKSNRIHYYILQVGQFLISSTNNLSAIPIGPNKKINIFYYSTQCVGIQTRKKAVLIPLMM